MKGFNKEFYITAEAVDTLVEVIIDREKLRCKGYDCAIDAAI